MAEYLSGFKHVLPHLSVIAPLKSTGKDDAINELFREVSLLDNLNRIHNLKDAVLRREMEGNTGIGTRCCGCPWQTYISYRYVSFSGYLPQRNSLRFI